MASAADTYTWSAYEASLKAYLGVGDASEDSLLALWLASAARDCDDYTGRDWLDSDGNDVNHPPLVELGRDEWVRAARESHNRSIGVTSVRTGQLSESYSDGASPVRTARAAACGYWARYVKDLTLAGVR